MPSLKFISSVILLQDAIGLLRSPRFIEWRRVQVHLSVNSLNRKALTKAKQYTSTKYLLDGNANTLSERIEGG
jgi:hypothetical protein